jgi:hypothetical protein
MRNKSNLLNVVHTAETLFTDFHLNTLNTKHELRAQQNELTEKEKVMKDLCWGKRRIIVGSGGQIISNCVGTTPSK